MVPGNVGIVCSRSRGEDPGDVIIVDFVVEKDFVVDDRDRLTVSGGGVGGRSPWDVSSEIKDLGV